MNKYEIPVIKRITFEVDFRKVYNAIKKVYPDFDDDDIYNEFGDNTEDYIKEVCPELKDINLCEDNEVWESVDHITYSIWKDFGKWIKENKK